MSAIYLDRHGWPAYAEDAKSGPLPHEQVAGLERVELDAENLDPSDIYQYMNRTVWAWHPQR